LRRSRSLRRAVAQFALSAAWRRATGAGARFAPRKIPRPPATLHKSTRISPAALLDSAGRRIARSALAGCAGLRHTPRFTGRARGVWQRASWPAFPQVALIASGLRSAHIPWAFIALCTRRNARYAWRGTGRVWCYGPTFAQIALIALALIAT